MTGRSLILDDLFDSAAPLCKEKSIKLKVEMDEKCGEAGGVNVDMWLRVVWANFGFVKTHHVDSHSQTVTAEQGAQRDLCL